jgi:phosphomannomutase
MAAPSTSMVNPLVLREYDIRGVIGDTLTEQDYRALGRAFGELLAENGGRSAAVGYDGRLTSPTLEQALVDGLAEAGTTIHRIGLCPTPMLYFAERYLDVDAGLMVTGSHNPPGYNGLKLSMLKQPFFGASIRELGTRASAANGSPKSGAIVDSSVADAYVDCLLSEQPRHKPLRVAWDPGNGACGEIAMRLCDRLPGTHVLINEAIDGTFPAHPPDPTLEENLAQLKAALRENHCDLGLAFDGDGDRVVAIDSEGRTICGDQLLVILAKEILAAAPGATIIADVKSSQVFFDEVARLGGNPIMSRTGHSIIKNLIAETGAKLAGEMSGHVFFADRYYGFDDGLYAAMRILAVVSAANETFAEMRDALPKMVNTPEIRIGCPDDRKFAVMNDVRDRVKSMPGLRVDTTDGVRVATDHGWWLLRPSNTEPSLIGRCEASDSGSLSILIEQLKTQLRDSGIEPPVITT